MWVKQLKRNSWEFIFFSVIVSTYNNDNPDVSGNKRADVKRLTFELWRCWNVKSDKWVTLGVEDCKGDGGTSSVKKSNDM